MVEKGLADCSWAIGDLWGFRAVCRSLLEEQSGALLARLRLLVVVVRSKLLAAMDDIAIYQQQGGGEGWLKKV